MAQRRRGPWRRAKDKCGVFRVDLDCSEVNRSTAVVRETRDVIAATIDNIISDFLNGSERDIRFGASAQRKLVAAVEELVVALMRRADASASVSSRITIYPCDLMRAVLVELNHSRCARRIVFGQRFGP